MPYIGNVLTSFAVETGNIADQAVTAPKLSATGGTNGQVLGLDAGGNLVWTSDPAGQWVTTGSDIYYTTGNVLVGTTSSQTNLGSTQAFQLEGNSFAKATLSVFADTNDQYGAGFILGKSRGTSVNSNTAVQNNDSLGEIYFIGANGTDRSNTGAFIGAYVDGDPFTGGDTTDLPGRLVFSTSLDGTSTLSPRMTIKNDGNVGVGTTAPSNPFTVQTTTRPQLHVSYNGNGGIYLTSANDVARTNWQIASSQTTANTLQIYPSDSVGGTTFTTPAVTIDSSSRVGIGVTSPDTGSLLHIANIGGIAKQTIESANNSQAYINLSAQSSEASIGYVRDGSGNGSIRFCFANDIITNESIRMPDFGGITFNGDTAAANALDDYEEGTWTVGVRNNTTGTLGTCYAKYRKIGTLVFCTINFTGSGFGGSGVVYITGLPFAHNGTSNDSAFSFNDCGHTIGIGTTADNPRLRMSGNELEGVKTLGSTTYLTWTQLGGGAGTLEFRGVFTYISA